MWYQVAMDSDELELKSDVNTTSLSMVSYGEIQFHELNLYHYRFAGVKQNSYKYYSSRISLLAFNSNRGSSPAATTSTSGVMVMRYLTVSMNFLTA